MPLQASSKASSEPPAAATSWPHSAAWQIDTSAGPQFAALNGDINLIHLSPVLARLFGFPSNIAHGLYLVSKSIAAMQQAGAVTEQLESMTLTLCRTSHKHVLWLQVFHKRILKLPVLLSYVQLSCRVNTAVDGSMTELSQQRLHQTLLYRRQRPERLLSLGSILVDRQVLQRCSLCWF